MPVREKAILRSRPRIVFVRGLGVGQEEAFLRALHTALRERLAFDCCNVGAGTTSSARAAAWDPHATGKKSCTILVGCGLGALRALNLAAFNPDQVVGVVAVDPLYPDDGTQNDRQRLQLLWIRHWATIGLGLSLISNLAHGRAMVRFIARKIGWVDESGSVPRSREEWSSIRAVAVAALKRWSPEIDDRKLLGVDAVVAHSAAYRALDGSLNERVQRLRRVSRSCREVPSPVETEGLSSVGLVAAVADAVATYIDGQGPRQQ